MRRDSKMLKRDQGLTAIELVVVVVMIALLVYVLRPTMGPHRHEVQAAIDRSNLKIIGVAFLEYSFDNNDMFPIHPRDAIGDSGDIDQDILLGPYQEHDAEVDRGSFDGAAVRYGGYVFLNLGIKRDDIQDPGETIQAYTALISEEQTKRSVLFADGHVEQWEDQELRDALPSRIDVDALDGP